MPSNELPGSISASTGLRLDRVPLHVASNVISQFGGHGVAAARVLLKRLENDVVQVAGELSPQQTRRDAATLTNEARRYREGSVSFTRTDHFGRRRSAGRRLRILFAHGTFDVCLQAAGDAIRPVPA